MSDVQPPAGPMIGTPGGVVPPAGPSEDTSHLRADAEKPDEVPMPSVEAGAAGAAEVDASAHFADQNPDAEPDDPDADDGEKSNPDETAEDEGSDPSETNETNETGEDDLDEDDAEV